MWLKFKNVATIVIETFHLLLLTLILANILHVKQIGNIVVMASTANSLTSQASATATSTTKTRTAVTTQTLSSSSSLSSFGIAARAASTLPLPSPTSAATTTFTRKAFTSLWDAETNASKLLNLTTDYTDDAIKDANEIDSMNDDNDDDHEAEFLLENYVMARHIALSDDSTRIATAAATATGPETLSTKLISVSPTPAVTLVTPSMSTATRRSHSPTATRTTTRTTTAMTRTTMTASSLASLVNHRFYANKTRLDDLSSLSLLSLNDTSAEFQISTSASSTSSSSLSEDTAPSQVTKSSHAPATSLRVKGNEQNMHNTNSHLMVDNVVNATIVVNSPNAAVGFVGNTRKPIGSTNMPTHQHQQQHHHHHHNSTSTATGRNSSSTADSGMHSRQSGGIGSSDAFLTATGYIGGGGAKTNGTGTTRISARKVDHKNVQPKSHKTDAPMLNYIFDTFSSANKHHHHDQRYGPHFEDVQLVGKPTNMTVQAGSSIHLNCRISLLQDKTVSWVRRNPDGENALDLLTVGLHTYTGDSRYKMEFQYPNNWRLKITNVKKDDEATYECQISTHPPRVIQINLHVNAPKVMIVDEFGDPLQEKYYEQDSTLQLSCVVRNVAMSSSVVFWKHSEDVLNYDVTRGGVSVKTELMDDGANSTLFIAKINKADSGNYTCSISEYQNYTIVVHILNGESFAELHHGNAICWHCPNHQTWAINLIVLATILLILPAYISR